MPKTRPPYSPEFRKQMVELVRSGRTPEELSREFEPSAQAIRNWVAQSGGIEESPRADVLSSAEREELRRLRRENRQLREEREIRAKARPGLLGRPNRSRRGLQIRESQPGKILGAPDVPPAGCLPQRVLRAWSHRSASRQAQADAELLASIRAIYERSRGTYGAPRVQADLRASGALARAARGGLRGGGRRA